MSIEWMKAKVARLEEALANKVMAAAEWTTLSRTTAASDKDHANVAANPNDRQRPIRRVAPWGLAGYPPAGILALLVKAVGGVFNGINAGVDPDKYGPKNLNEGETALYCKESGTTILLDKDGNVIITPGAGKTVQIAGSTHPLPLWDTFESDLMNALATIPKTPSTPYPGLSDGGTLMTTLTSRLAGGSYESTKAKNG
jgi:hypothetical protein